jgi:2-oxoisovalerate dehydrogenase E2 component (dihydrolipoyl transacylase)
MIEVKMPRLGESIAEGTVARWNKAVGDSIALREPLLEISTDKIDTEIPSPGAGTLQRILVPEGETVAVGTLLALIGEAGESVPPDDTPSSDSLSPDAPPTDAQTRQHAETPPSEAPTGRGFFSPVVQKIAAEHDIDLRQIELSGIAGSGMGGRITKKDLLTYLEMRTEAEPEVASTASSIGAGEPVESLTPLTSMRRAIAQHMLQSVRTAPHVATLFEVDMSAVVRHREQNRAAFERNGMRLTYSAYFVHAVAQALRAHPLVNGSFSDAGIRHNRAIHIGVAVSLGKDGSDGLIVPVLRDADRLSLSGVAQGIEELRQRALANALQPDDLQGGTFTITNHGIGGSILGTPIIVQPQAAILGIGAIVKRPVVINTAQNKHASLLPSADDAIVIRPMCYLTLSFDHRILDGASADAFLRDVQYELQAWD